MILPVNLYLEGEKRRKTETIKERAIYVYLPSHEMVKAWKKRATLFY